MKLKKITKNEFANLINLMNLSFGFNKGNEFTDILPKYYFKDNKEMLHYGIYEDDKLVSSIGLYDVELISPYGKLKCGAIGGAATHPDYRNRGYFTIILKKLISVARKKKYDLLFLSGKVSRYKHFGFEEAGRLLSFDITKESLKNINNIDYEIMPLDKNNKEAIKECLKLYNETIIHARRTESNFYNHAISWKTKPYLVKINNQIVGYYSLKREDLVFEFVYKNGYRDVLLKAILGNKAKVNINTNTLELDNDLISKIASYSIKNMDMFKILNYESTLSFLNISPAYLEELKKKKSSLRIKSILGDSSNASKYTNLPMFIHICDKG